MMFDVENLLDSLERPNRAEGDYEKDGRLYCGKCHTPKQALILGKLRPCTCECQEAEQRKEKAEQKRAAIEKYREEVLPRENQQRSRFDTAEESNALGVARNYVAHWDEMRSSGTGLIFYGPVGTGKSHAGLCIANALMDKGESVRYITAADALAQLTSRDVDQKQFLEKMCTPSLLIIDDLGAEHDSGYSQAQMCRIIDARHESGKPYVVTTNYSLDEMKSPADRSRQRIFDRVLGYCVPVLVDGQSRRQKEGRERLEKARRLLA